MTAAVTSGNPIRVLNDAVRRAGPSGLGQWVLTAGISERGLGTTALAIRAVMAFEAFTTDNDPHNEHDFGSFNLSGETLFWKMDYYNQSLDGGSEDPADPAQTRRVITIMLASEY